MYINCAYLGKRHEDIVSSSVPLLITAVGNYRIHSEKVFKTLREKGRKDYQIVYIANGKLHLYLNGKYSIIQKGNMILFRPGDPQIYDLFASDQAETYWVHFTGNNIERLLDYYNISRDKSVFFTGLSSNYKWLFRQMIQELQLRRKNFNDTLPLQLRLLMLYISRSEEDSPPVSAELFDEVETAMHYFNKYFYMPIVIEEYAKQHKMTPCWFIQNFKKIAHATPMQYIVSLRISNAMNLLDNTNYSVEKIANSVGYENALYFSRLFRKHTGLSPRDYKKRNKQQTNN